MYTQLFRELYSQDFNSIESVLVRDNPSKHFKTERKITRERAG